MANLYTIDNTNNPTKTDLVLLGQADKERSATLKDVVESGFSKEIVSDNLEVWQKGIPEDFEYTETKFIYTDIPGEYTVDIDIKDISNKHVNVFVDGVGSYLKYTWNIINYNETPIYLNISIIGNGTGFPRVGYLTIKINENKVRVFVLSNDIMETERSYSLDGWYIIKNNLLLKL